MYIITKRATIAAAVLVACSPASPGEKATSTTIQLLNVSYDPTRELYAELNPLFARQWEAKTGQKVDIQQSHGGSGKQARSVIDGLEADVVTLALSHDVDQIGKAGLLSTEWQKALPDNSAPYTSTIVFLVRQGNPKGIRDWGDLVKEGVGVITPNPKTGGASRWAYLAAWGWAQRQPGGSEDTAKALVTGIYKNVLVLDSGARGSATTFLERGIGDVLITWENEALLAQKNLGSVVELVVPSKSILAEPSVAVVDAVARKKGTIDPARAYLELLYSDEGQELVARHFYRPRNARVLAKYAAQYKPLELFTVAELGGWDAAQQKHFVDGAIFDQIYQPK